MFIAGEVTWICDRGIIVVSCLLFWGC